MELVKNIFFNTDKIVEGAKVKISYVGSLFQNGSNEVYLHYGYGENWNNVGEIKTEKTELGYQAEITIPHGYKTLNLCYKNENGDWDNNCGKDYTFNIEKNELTTEDVAEDALTGVTTGTTPVNQVYNTATGGYTIEDIVNSYGESSFGSGVTSSMDSTEETGLVETYQTGMQVHKGLRKTYIWSKKIKLAIYKIIKYVPKIISGNYKRKVNEQ